MKQKPVPPESSDAPPPPPPIPERAGRLLDFAIEHARKVRIRSETYKRARHRGQRFTGDWGNDREIDQRLAAGDFVAVSDGWRLAAEAFAEAAREWDRIYEID